MENQKVHPYAAGLKDLFAPAVEVQQSAPAKLDDPRSDFGVLSEPFSAYVHVPFCRVRCGYCDFNTYTKDFSPAASRDGYFRSVQQEIRLAKRFMEEQGIAPPNLASVYFGGGTPTLLSADSLKEILLALKTAWPLRPGAEVSIEANPDTLTPAFIRQLAEAGFNRVSVGMQSAVRSVLRILDRTHDPERIPLVIDWIKSQGMQVSLDLIYGTPGETLSDWEKSLQFALSQPIDHLSAYSLVIEPGTKMGRQLRKGLISEIDPDQQADKYLLADRYLQQAGLRWYEISNWARPLPGEQENGKIKVPDATHLANASVHNLAYWRNWNWWGFGPGAHSHLQGRRFWNRKHPLAYARSLEQGNLPVQSGEQVDGSARELERLMLGLRTARGVELQQSAQRALLPNLVRSGLIQSEPAKRNWAVLTLKGRLLADWVTEHLSL